MATSVAQLRSWFDAGVAQGATHMIVVCDTFDYEDYPIYVKPGENVRELTAEFDPQSRMGRNMQKLMEVYDLRLDREMQMAEYRAFHF